MRAILAGLILVASAAQARAEPPAVVTDIAPVQSLVAQVMGDLGAPDLLLDPQTDPHHVQLRPSQARMIARAGLVIWMGETMTPWLRRVLDNLGDGTGSLELLTLDPLPLRIEVGVAHRGTHDEGHVDGPFHDALDPHAWLDPLNAAHFLAAIAEALARADPEHAVTYRANAARAQDRLTALTAETAARLAPLHDRLLVPYHDAYDYFFHRFGLPVAGSIAGTDAAAPGAAHIAEIRDLLAANPDACVFTEPGANNRLIRAVLPGAGTPPTLDPLGTSLPPGPDLYEALIRQMVDAVANCGKP